MSTAVLRFDRRRESVAGVVEEGVARGFKRLHGAKAFRTFGSADLLQRAQYRFVSIHDHVLGRQSEEQALLEQMDTCGPLAHLWWLEFASAESLRGQSKVHRACTKQLGCFIDEVAQVCTTLACEISFELLAIGAPCGPGCGHRAKHAGHSDARNRDERRARD